MMVVLFAAQSADGWITRGAEPGDGFTSEADKEHFRAALRACDACVMGSATYELSRDRLRPQLWPELRRIVWTKDPSRRASEARPGVLEFSDESPEKLTARLKADGRKRCAVLGGGQVNGAWLQAGLVDELCLTVESRLFGRGTPLASFPHPDLTSPSPPADIRLSLLEARVLAAGGPVLLRYAVNR
jgi:dihydrofolate reductase